MPCAPTPTSRPFLPLTPLRNRKSNPSGSGPDGLLFRLSDWRSDAAHLVDLQREGEGQAQVGVGRERAEDLLELADAVAQRVVVEEEQAGGLGDVHVRVEQDAQGLAQAGILRR